MTFARKYIEVDFDLAQGVFAGGGNTYTASGLRVSAQIVKAGGLSPGMAHLAIYGLPLSTMNQLGTFGIALTEVGKNTVTVKAGEDPNALTTVFTGTIFNAYMDGQGQPQVSFRVDAMVSLFEKVKPASPTSQAGGADVATLMGTMAKAAGLQFENNGVATKIVNPYYPGSTIQQINKLAKDTGIAHHIDNGVLSIWPPGKSRSGAPTVISPSTGLVGYPRFNSQGIDITCLWQPGLEYGKQIKVESSITPACGIWSIYRLEYELESETPGGPWFCEIMANPPGLVPVA